MSVSEPGKIITPWAESGLKNPIPPAANPATGRAGFDQGFSAINMTAKEAGGIPPFGQDFNGIFYEVTNILRYMQAGGQPTFDAAMAAAIGGYPKGAMVLGSDGVTLWQSKVDSNSTDPNTDPSDWGTFDIGLKEDLAAPNGSINVGFQQAGVGAVPRTAEDKMREIITPHDFASPEAMIAEAIGRARTAAVFNSYFAFTITAGVGGDYPTLLEALIAAQAMRPFYDDGQAFCEVKLKTGYVLNTQTAFGAGADLSWIKITSEDAIVYCDTAAFTTSVVTYYDYKYLFYIHHGTKAPTFAIQMEESRVGSDVVAFIVTAGSQVTFWPGSGARKFKGGVHATYGSDVIGYHTGTGTAPVGGYYLCDFSNCVDFSLSAMINCRVHLPYSNFKNCTGAYAVFCIWSTIADFRYSAVDNCTGIGWYIRDGSVVSIREHTATNCDIGIKAYHGVLINARNHDTDDDGIPLDALAQKGLYGCRTAGIYVDGTCTVEACSTDMRNCKQGFQMFRNSSINAQSCCLDGQIQVVAATTNCALTISRVSALNIGQLCDISSACTLVSWISNISGPAATNSRFMNVREGSKATLESVTLDTNQGLFAENMSDINIDGCTLGVLRLSAYYMCRVNVQGSTFNFARTVVGTPILNVQRGGQINAVQQRGTLGEALTSNVAVNTLSSAGVIYYV